MRWKILVGLVAVWALVGCHALTQPNVPGSVLPLRSLKLYETGVGYFERSGKLSTEGSMTLPVPTAHLDDALKTLVVLGDGQSATLTGFEFSSSFSQGMARSLAGLPASVDEPITFRNLLGSVKGSTVEIRVAGGTPETVEGRLVDVVVPENAEAPPRVEPPDTKGEPPARPPKAELTLLVVTRAGEFRRFDIANVISVRPTDPNLVTRMSAALDALSVRNAQTRRALRLLASSAKPITLGYLAETPIWRTTYRLLLDPVQERGRLQAWALVHNDTDEPWAKVRVELVNGQPDSFLFPLAAPRYSRRPLAEPAEKLATVPQLQDTTVDQLWGDNLEERTVGYGSGSGMGQGYGSASGSVGGSHITHAPQLRAGETSDTASDALRIGNLAEIVPATGVEAGALFSYQLAQPLDLQAHGSALVPFLASEVLARRLTWFSTPGQPGRSGLRFVNATGQTLPAAPIAIYESGGFAGETGLERLKPTGRAFLTFGVDLDVELDETKNNVQEQTKDVYFENERLVEDFIRVRERSLALSNRARRARTVYLALDIVDNSSVEGADELDYDQAGSKPLAVFRVEAGKKLERLLRSREGLQRSEQIQTLEARRVKELAALVEIPATARSLLSEAGARLDEAEAKSKEQEETNAALTEVNEDLKRLREHLQALGDKGGEGAGANPLVKRILVAEDRLSALRLKLKSLNGAAKEKRVAARVILVKLMRRSAAAKVGALNVPPP